MERREINTNEGMKSFIGKKKEAKTFENNQDDLPSGTFIMRKKVI